MERYLEYVESAVREGLEKSPWEELTEQALLGGESCLEQVRGQVAGDEREQRGARRLAAQRPGWEAVIRAVERVRGEKWEDFRDRHGDRGRDLVLYLARNVCGLKRMDLAGRIGAREYASVAMAIKRYTAHVGLNDAAEKQLKRVAQLLHVKM